MLFQREREQEQKSVKEKIAYENKVYMFFFFLTTQTRCISKQKALTVFLIYLVALECFGLNSIHMCYKAILLSHSQGHSGEADTNPRTIGVFCVGSGYH